MTPRFHALTVSDLRRESPDAVSVAFAVPPELAADYAFVPGQYLTLRTTLAGRELRRSYSICAGPQDGELRIAIKRVEGGAVSGWANEALAPGHEVDVMTPTGRFGAVEAQAGALHVGVAAGSGITPILSILKGVLARQDGSRFVLFYGNRSTADMLFRAEIEELKDRHLGRLSVFHVLSREEQDLPVLNGRLDAGKLRLLLGRMVPPEAVDHIYVCGPAGLASDVEATAAALGIPAERVHVERFVSEFDGVPRPPAPKPAPDAPPAHLAMLVVDGKRREVPVAEGETVLEAALRAGMDLPYACKGGMCSTCRAKVVEGAVRMDVNYSLEPWELQAGFVLTCQAHPTTERVAVDFDAM